MSVPDFGQHTIVHESGGYKAELSCRYIAPGLTFTDLMNIFDDAEARAEPGDHLRGDPSKWPNNRDVLAVVDAVLGSIYKDSVA